jgi:hypothetical protein
MRHPPIEINHHPHEYKCSSTKELKGHIFSRQEGRLALSAIEPSPINLLANSPRASTTVSSKLSFFPGSQTQIDISQWKPVAKSRLRIRTFSTICKLHEIPTLAASQSDPFLKMVERNERWEVRECGPVVWRKAQLPGSARDEEGEMWTADFKVPVSVPKTYLPTFLNLLSARQYALVLRVSIPGLRHNGALEVAIPLQLICYDQDNLVEVGDDLLCDSQDDGEW